MTSRPHRPDTARPGWQVNTDSRTALLRHYGDDDEFGQALGQLFASCCELNLVELESMPDLLSYEIGQAAHGTRRPWIERYLRNLATISERFGLYRLEPLAGGTVSVASRSYGELLIHRWCVTKGRLYLRGKDLNASWFVMGDGFAGPAPEIGQLEFAPVDTSSDWDPDTETQAEAERRMVNAASRSIHEGLSRVATAAEDDGYIFQRPANADRDVLLVFWRLRHRFSYQQIATKWNVSYPDSRPMSQGAVIGATTRMADRIAVDRVCWKSSGLPVQYRPA